MTVDPIPGLSAREAAVILDVTPRYVDRLVSDGKLPKAVRHAKAGLDRDVVEQVSLDRLRRGRPHEMQRARARRYQSMSRHRRTRAGTPQQKI